MAERFYVEALNLNHNPIAVPPALTLRPRRWSAAAVGGPVQAEIEAEGPLSALWETMRWLRYGVRIRNRTGTPVWWGYIDEVTVGLGEKLAISLSLENLYNRVAVQYTYEDGGGATQDATTEWVQDALSSARYGVRELLYSKGDINEIQADAIRDRLLAQFAVPRGVAIAEGGASLIAGGASEGVRGTLRCRGWWSTLGWRYYANPAGREGHEIAGGANQALGAGATSATETGFQALGRIIFNTGSALYPGSKFVVSGSASNDGTYTVASLNEQETEIYTASTITFAEPGETDDDDVYDSAGGMAVFENDDVIQITGSSLNDGIYAVKTQGASTMEVKNGSVTYEAAGASVTISRRSYVVVKEALAEEDAGASLTITAHGQMVAQSFTPEYNASFALGEITVRLRKEGDPSDKVRCALWSNSGGNPYAEIEGVEIDASDLSRNMGWVSFRFSGANTVNYGTTYWVVLSRTGTPSLIDYYVVDMDEQTGYGLGSLKLWTGASWAARTPDADMPFVAWGVEDTATQVHDIVQAMGDLLDGAVIDGSVGVEARQYRSGENTALDEIEDLLLSGTAADRRLMATVQASRRVVIQSQPAASAGYDWVMHADGRITREQDQEAEPGVLPAGRWVQLPDVPGQVDMTAALTPVFVERAEYDAQEDALSWEPEGAPDPWAVGEVRQG